MAAIPKLNELHEQWSSKGLAIVGVTNEPAGLVEATVKEREMRYPIARVSGGGADAAYGITGFPTLFLVAPSGEIVWLGHGHDYESLLPELLEQVVIVPGLTDKKHAAIGALIEKRDYGAAWKKLAAALEKAPADAELGAARAAIEAACAAQLKFAAKKLEGSSFAEARTAYLGIAELFDGVPGAATGAEHAAAIAADPAAEDDLAAGALRSKALAERAKGKKANRENAERMLDKLLETYPETPTAERVRAARR